MSKHVFVAIVAVLLLKTATVVAQPIQWEGNGHFYEFVEAPGIHWSDSRAAAASRQHNGIPGHLLTITSLAENNFVRDAWAEVANSWGWIGASDSETEGEWLWVDGPEAGTQFWQGGSSGSTTPPFHFANWASTDPTGGEESFGEMSRGPSFGFPAGVWGDANNAGVGGLIAGYFVEYSEIDSPDDLDGDGLPDDEDDCPDSDLDPGIVIDDCETGVENQMLEDGCTMADLIAQCTEGVAEHGAYVRCVAHLTNFWRCAGLINGGEKGHIQSCAAQADIP